MSNNSSTSLVPSEIAKKTIEVGIKKSNLDIVSLFLLSMLAGAYIGFGANFCTITITGAKGTLPFGIIKLLGGLVFTLGLILVVVAGAELFTGNCLIVMSVMSKKTSVNKLLYNWIVVYIGNFVGSILTAYFIYLSEQYKLGGNGVGLTAVNIANAKCGLSFVPAFFRGIYCNTLVCLAVWLCLGGKTVTDKILAIIPPISAFVAGGFEHCVANMYFIPMGLFVNNSLHVKTATNLTWGNFFIKNLIPVTLGNIVGGAVFVGVIYWLIYCRKED